VNSYEWGSMTKRFRSSSRLFVALVIALAFLAASLVSGQPVQAGGSGGIDVQVARVCLNGVRFTGTVTNPAVLGRTIVSHVFRGHVGVPSPLVATGTSATYSAVGQTRQFTVTYPVSTFAVGEAVTYSALANDTSGYGGGQFAYVENCYLGRGVVPPLHITSGRWTNVATLIEDTCGGASAGATFPVTLTQGPGLTRLSLDWYAQHFAMRRNSRGAYTGLTTVGDGTYRLTLTFSSATAYSGNLEVTFPSCPRRHWLFSWAGTADAG
jgi:hypothetical protein